MYVVSGSSSVVEHLLAKEKVASSNLVFRSIFMPSQRHKYDAPFAGASLFLVPWGCGGDGRPYAVPAKANAVGVGRSSPCTSLRACA